MGKIEKYIEEIDDKNIKFNIKLFPIYYSFSYDFLFFYAIEFVFLSQVKNFTSSQILLLDSMIPHFVYYLIYQLLCLLKEMEKESHL